MSSFHSKTLNRTFDLIYFVSALQVGGQPASATSPHVEADPTAVSPPTGAPIPVTGKIEGIRKPKNGKTIAEIFSEKANLAGNQILVRGKIIKYNNNIMGRNWLHIQDGSGSPGSNDLTVTTNDTAAVGKTVLVQGILATDKDFGSGYKYDVLIEQAKLTVE